MQSQPPKSDSEIKALDIYPFILYTTNAYFSAFREKIANFQRKNPGDVFLDTPAFKNQDNIKLHISLSKQSFVTHCDAILDLLFKHLNEGTINEFKMHGTDEKMLN